MSFEKTVEALIAGPAPVAPPLLKFETSKKLSRAFGRDLKVPAEITEKQVRAAVKPAGEAHVQRGKSLAAFAKLSPTDRRKASALVAAGTHGGKVADHFKALTPGSFKGAVGTADQLRKGLALAKAQKLKLDAATW